MLGVSRQRVSQLVESYADFPEPEVRLSSGRVWAREAVAAWMSLHGDRKPGRAEAELMEAAFSMPIDDVFDIKGRGTVVAGTIERGIVHPGDDVRLLDESGGGRVTEVIALERFRRVLRSASAGEAVGVLLRDVRPQDVRPGMRLVHVAQRTG
jgi:translation elongation factor EF-Tu-like GTPase